MHYLLFDLEDADLTDKQKKQALNPHIELRECFYFHIKILGFIATYQGQLSLSVKLTITQDRSGLWSLTSTLCAAEFSDASAKFYCRIYYAEEFHKMREEIMESSEEDFVRSLSHCVNWQARGGKSGAVFYATEGLIQNLKKAFNHSGQFSISWQKFERFLSRSFEEGDERLRLRSLIQDCVLSFVVRRPFHPKTDAQAGGAVLLGLCSALLHLHHWSCAAEGQKEMMRPIYLKIYISVSEICFVLPKNLNFIIKKVEFSLSILYYLYIIIYSIRLLLFTQVE